MDNKPISLAFSIFALQVVATATILIGVTLNKSAVWDEYKTIAAPPTPGSVFRVDAYQSLWWIDVRHDATSLHRAYPLPDEESDTGWRETAFTLVLTSACFGGACFLSLLLGAILQCTKPHHGYQIATLVINIVMCTGAGATGFVGTHQYADNFQTVLRPNVLQHPDRYNPAENELGTAYWLALVGSATFGIASVIMIIHLIYEIIKMKTDKKIETEVKPF